MARAQPAARANPLMLATFLIVVAVTAFVVSYAVSKDAFAPLGLFALAWFVPLGLAVMGLSALQDSLKATTWIMVLGSAASFLAGMGLTALIVPGGKARMSRASLSDTLDDGRLRVLMLGLYAIALVCFAYEAKVAGNIPILVDPSEQTTAYRNFPLPFIHYGTISAITVSLLAFIHLWVFGRKRATIPLVLFALSAVQIVAILARQQILLIAFLCLFVVHYTGRRPVRIGWLILFAASMLAIFIVVGGARAGDAQFAMQLSGTYLPKQLQFLVWPYLYLALNFQVLQSLSSAGLPRTMGAQVLLPILSFTFTRRLFPVPNVEGEVGWFNTYTYLWPIFSDFGLVGTLLVPFVYGALTCAAYRHFRRRPSLGSMTAYALAAFCVVFVFQSNGFAFPPFYVIAGEAWLVVVLCTRRAARHGARDPIHVFGEPAGLA